MKKILLCILLPAFAFSTFGQSPNQTFNLINRVDKRPVFTPDPVGGGQTEVVIGQKLSETFIGETWYDLQTYGAIAQRTYTYPDGTAAATWMMAFDITAWEDRGIGYNFFDGNEWGEYPDESIASVRTGWASYAPLGENGEIACGHALEEDEWVTWFCKRETRGEGDWDEFYLSGPQPGVGIVWPVLVTNGADHNTIHLLSRTYGDEYMGQENGALLYSRSTDGGETWDIENHFFEELGPDYFEAVGADGYAWAAPKDNTLAFSVGFDSGHGCIMKSTDNGDTWEFIEVFNCPFYPPPGEETPTFGAGDGSQALAIDNNNNVHLVFGRMRHVYDEAGTGLYYPATDGVIYWNETMEPLDTTIISSYTLEFLEENGNLVGWVVEDGIPGLLDIAAYFNSLTCDPQIVVDASNRIFVIWSGVAPSYDNGLYNYRHIYGNSSSDGGLTWNGIKDLTDDLIFLFSECAYPSLAPTINDGKIHFTFQMDNEPGIYVWAESQTAAGLNNITYMDVAVEELVGIDKTTAGVETIKVSQNTPNPFFDETVIDVELAVSSDLLFTVTDLSGRMVHREHIGKSDNRHVEIRFNRENIPGGVYFYSINSGSEQQTGKMIIQ